MRLLVKLSMRRCVLQAVIAVVEVRRVSLMVLLWPDRLLR
jgi:hypothetical protein